MALPRFPSDRNRLKSIICSIRSWLLCFLSGCIVGHLHGRYWDKNNNDSVLLLSSLSSLSSSSSSSLTSSSSSFPALTLTDNTNTNNNNATTDGWRQIDVFYGEPAVSNLTWFSQAAQDELIVGLLRGKRNGYFIDLAANDALVLSNTYALERDYGWTGLCIEPNPKYWKQLIQYRKCHTVAAVVGATRLEPVWFRFKAGELGGIADEGFDNGKRWQRASERAYTVTLFEIFERYNVPKEIDYLSLDVEGAETFVMKNFPLSQYRIKIITAERLKGDIREFLKQHGYEFVERLTRWGESLWVHSSVRDELDWTVLERLKFPRD